MLFRSIAKIRSSGLNLPSPKPCKIMSCRFVIIESPWDERGSSSILISILESCNDSYVFKEDVNAVNLVFFGSNSEIVLINFELFESKTDAEKPVLSFSMVEATNFGKSTKKIHLSRPLWYQHLGIDLHPLCKQFSCY